MKNISAYALGSYGFLSLALSATPAVLAENLRDPMRPPASFETAQQGNASIPASGPVLQSVLISPGRMVAIISGHTVKLGEKFGDATVIKITESEVVLRNGNGNDVQTLKLFPSVEKRASIGRVATHSNRGGK